MRKRDLLKETIEHIDITSFDATAQITAMKKMSFTSRDTAEAAEILKRMTSDKDCSVILTLAGSTGAGGCLKVYADMIRYNMVDAVVATGASIIDMDFFEALGFKHYRGVTDIPDKRLREFYIDRIYDTFIDEDDLQLCDQTIKKIADELPPGVYSSREFIYELGRYLGRYAVKKDSLVQLAYENSVPVFCPAFSDSSAGFGLVKHQWEHPDRHVVIDSVRDFRELTMLKIAAVTTGLFMVGGGVPKNFVQDTVVCAEMLGEPVPMHKYAVQITVADPRDGACSSSTLKEASSWGKVDTRYEQMVYAEATSVIPLIISYIYHGNTWKKRPRHSWNDLYADADRKKPGAIAQRDLRSHGHNFI